ncbi:MAG: amidohydrolase family protein [Promethearchaeota archaeon]
MENDLIHTKTAPNIVRIPNVEKLGYKVIDFHCHFQGNKESIEKHIRNLIKFNIKSICLMPSFRTLNTIDISPTIQNDFNNSNQYFKLIRKLKKNEFEIDFNSLKWNGKIFIFLPILFEKNIKEFEQLIQELNPAGLKLHPLQGFDINKKTLDPWMMLAKKYNLIVYIHTDWVPSTEWKKTKNLMAETFCKIVKLYPQNVIVMGHAGSNDSYLNIWKYVKKYKNIIVETSLSPTPQELEKVIYKADPNRIVFGSDFPFSKIEGEIIKIHKMKRVNLEQKEAVFYENAKNILKNRPYIKIEYKN